MKAPEFNEIVFENRNKEYGAYSIRKSYKKRMLIAISISITVLLLAVSFPLLASFLKPTIIINSDTDVTADLINNKIPDDIAKPIPPPPPIQEAKYKTFYQPIVGDGDSSEVVFSDPDVVINNPIDTSETINIIDEVVKKPDIIETPPPIPVVVEEMPEFIGGESALGNFLLNNLVYPTLAQESGIHGVVYLKFVVETDGSISNITLLRGIGGGCDEEAIRVIFY